MCRKLPLFGLLLIGLTFFSAAPALAVKIGVLPFAVYSQEDLKYLSEGLQDLIGRNLSRQGIDVVPATNVVRALGKTAPTRIDERLARRLGKAVTADYMLYGSLTKAGQRLSLDARLVDARGRKKTVSVFVQADGLDKLNEAAEQVAAEATLGLSGSTRIARIEIKGNERIEADAIRRVLQSQTGDLYSESRLSADLKRVYEMNYFEDVQVEVADAAQGKAITFIVVEKPAVTQIEIRGNRRVDEKDILDSLGYSLYSILDQTQVGASVERIKEMYRQKGYYNAEVTYKIESLPQKRASIRYDIKEGKRLYVQKIQFLGNKAYSDRRLRGEMETSRRHFWSWVNDTGILKQDEVTQDQDKIRNFYMNHGYIHVRVGAPEVKVEKDGLAVVFSIDEGEQFKVGKISFSGDVIFDRDVLLDDIKIDNEKVFNREIVGEDVRTLKTLYADKGYAYNRVEPLVRENPGDLTVDIDFQIQKNQLVTFERITISGNEGTRDKVIRRQLEMKEGDLFSAQALQRSSRNLYRLDYFDDVSINSTEGSDSSKMNLAIDVKEHSTAAFSVGAGYSSYNNLFGTVSIYQNNLFGTGKKLKAEATLGGSSTNYTLSFTDPWMFDRPLAGGFDIFRDEADYDDYDRTTIGFALRMGYPIFKDTWLTGRYLFQDIEIYNLETVVSNEIKRFEGGSLSSSFSLQLVRDTRDRIFNPTEGSNNIITVTQAGGILGGDNHYTQYIVNSGWFIPLPIEGFTFFVRGKGGYMTENQENGLPSYEKFYLGGIDSVRGYEWYSISPKDPVTGDDIGGEKMALFNVEIIFPLFKEAGVMGVVFFDQGNVWSDTEDYDLGDLRKSYGAGIRYYSPLGPMRLEWGKTLDPIEGDPESQWEFSIGSFF